HLRRDGGGADGPALGPVRTAGAVTALVRSVTVRWALAGVVIALALLVPPLAGLQETLNPDATSRFTLFLGTEALVFALWAISYNLMLGYTGLVSFAHAAYYGIGAYSVALFYDKLHGSPLLGLLIAPLVTAA